MKNEKMIRGARALAAALAGAPVFFINVDGAWLPGVSVQGFRRAFDQDLPLAKRYGVRASDAKRVLG